MSSLNLLMEQMSARVGSQFVVKKANERSSFAWTDFS
ncbi:hypothetical protein A5802_000903 [Enterococcus mundtii]|uniref:Uncharacterized protein n=1 Tax=Enterococcus mundtii TaxID=53346 RepID=A0A242KZG6_ENTMU|nr:hypothetical protein A5802_000903 [Enterococcus mundtii]